MEWDDPAVLLDVSPFNEADALALVLTATHGAWRGLVRGGLSRAHAATWQRGNLLSLRWVARLPEQLGSFTAEIAHPTAALAMADPLRLAILNAACDVAGGALPEREPHADAFAALARLFGAMGIEGAALPALARFELVLLRELGFGLDLSRCAVSGTANRLAYVSPRTGRAVSEAAAGEWAARLLPLPGFLLAADEEPADTAACREALALTGHFLARDAFGARHRPLPEARAALMDRLAGL